MIEEYKLSIPFTRESWNGRMKACRGVGASLTEKEISDWENALPSYIHLAYLPKPGLIRLRLDGVYHDKEFLNEELDKYKSQLIARLAEDVLCDEDYTLQEILLQYLNKLNLTVATAESCTGGNIAHLITSVAGSSSVFMGSVVAYSNDVKHRLLSVKQETLDDCINRKAEWYIPAEEAISLKLADGYYKY
jgi:nicotinamide-nucleotide amidase